MPSKIYIFLVLAVIVLGSYFLFFQNKEGTSIDSNALTPPETNVTVTMKTNFGEISLELFNDKAPKTVENFIKLSESSFYDGVKFHRVIKGFMIQSGDPLTKDDSQKNAWVQADPGLLFLMRFTPRTAMSPAPYLWQMPDRIPTAANFS